MNPKVSGCFTICACLGCYRTQVLQYCLCVQSSCRSAVWNKGTWTHGCTRFGRLHARSAVGVGLCSQSFKDTKYPDWKVIHFSLSGLFWCLFCDICAVQMENCGAALQIALFALPFLVPTNRPDCHSDLRHCEETGATHTGTNSCAYIFVRTHTAFPRSSSYPTTNPTATPKYPTRGQAFDVVKTIQKVLTLLLQCTIWSSKHITYKHTHGD